MVRCRPHLSLRSGEGHTLRATRNKVRPVQRNRPAEAVSDVSSGECAMDAIELCYMPAMELGVAIRSKKVSPVEVVDAVLARIERLNPTLNAYCTLTAAAARAAAKEAEAAVMRG